MEYSIVNKMTVTPVQMMGTDLTTVNAARISFNGEKEMLDVKDEKLINFLAKNKHMSPFEHSTATFIIECPLFIRSQIHRHRTFAYNEVSRRYTSEDLAFYIPEALRQQAKSNRQASEGELQESAKKHSSMKAIQYGIEKSVNVYEELIDNSVAREIARGSLPQNLMTRFFMTGNLRNWAHFIELRIDSHAQVEAQMIAQQLADQLQERFPVSFGALMKYITQR